VIPRRVLLGAALAVPGLARAQASWPEKPVRIIVPFPPGQAADILTRLLAEELSGRWSQRAFVENRGGGAGVPALEAAARAAPDGYTLVAGTSGTLGVNPSVVPRIPYDAERDFAFISNIAMVPLLIVAHPSFPGRTAQDIVAMAKARPGAVNMATAGPATSQHMAAELFMLATGTVAQAQILLPGAAPAPPADASGAAGGAPDYRWWTSGGSSGSSGAPSSRRRRWWDSGSCSRAARH
jgi:tripartite-type tricarboxylate transporter receptor subunit TctC